MFIILLRLRERTQLSVPIGFERIRHQAILGIDPQIAPLRQFRLITSPFHLLAPQAVSFLQARLQLFLHG